MACLLGAEKGGGVNELHLFAGAGGGILGSELLGIRTVCAVELEPYPSSVLLARQNDGLLPPFPVWDDVRTFDGRRWRGLVDVVSGGFPCQDISAAGKGAGIDGARSGLWREMHRIINELRPEFAFLENSPLLVGRGLARVLGDLAEIGYDAEWLVLGADDVGAPHVRKRIWILAHDPHANGLQRPQQGEPFTGTQEPDGCSDNRLDAGDDVANSDNERSRRRVEFPACRPEPRNVANAPCGEVQRGKPGVMAGPICGRKSINSTAGTGREIRNPASQGFQDRRSRPMEQSSPKPEPERPDCKIPDSNLTGLERQWSHPRKSEDPRTGDDCQQISNALHQRDVRGDGEWWSAEPDVGRVAHGVAARVDRLKAIGNGQVPAVAATAFRVLLERFTNYNPQLTLF